MVEFTLALSPGEYVNSYRFRWERSSRTSHGVDILHHVPGNPENTKCLFFFLRLCQRPPRTVFMYSCHSLPVPRSKIPSSPVRGVLSTQPCLHSHGNRGMFTLGCRNSIRVPNSAGWTCYGLPWTGQHKTGISTERKKNPWPSLCKSAMVKTVPISGTQN